MAVEGTIHFPSGHIVHCATSDGRWLAGTLKVDQHGAVRFEPLPINQAAKVIAPEEEKSNGVQ